MRSVLATLFATCALLVCASSCGGGAIAAAAAAAGGSEEAPPVGPDASGLAVFSTKTSPVAIRWDAREPNGDRLEIRIEWSDDGEPVTAFAKDWNDATLRIGRIEVVADLAEVPNEQGVDQSAAQDDVVELAVNAMLANPAPGAEAVRYWRLWDVVSDLGVVAGEIRTGIDLRVVVAEAPVSGPVADPVTLVLEDVTIGNERPELAELEASGELGPTPIGANLLALEEGEVGSVGGSVRITDPTSAPANGGQPESVYVSISFCEIADEELLLEPTDYLLALAAKSEDAWTPIIVLGGGSGAPTAPNGATCACSGDFVFSDFAVPSGGVTVGFAWDVLAHDVLVDRRTNVVLRASATEADQVDGIEATFVRVIEVDGFANCTFEPCVESPVLFSDPIVVDNNERPLAALDSGGFALDPDTRRGVPIPFQIFDLESNPAKFLIQWRRPSQSFAELDPFLPANLAGLETLLADPVARRVGQIATELPIRVEDRAIPAGDAALVLPSLASQNSFARIRSVDADGDPITLEGRRLELLRDWRVPRALSEVTPGAAGFPAETLDVASTVLGPAIWTLDASALRLVDPQTGALVTSAQQPEGVSFAQPQGDGQEFTHLSVTPDRRGLLVGRFFADRIRVARIELGADGLPTTEAASFGTIVESPIAVRGSYVAEGASLRALSAVGPRRVVAIVGDTLLHAGPGNAAVREYPVGEGAPRAVQVIDGEALVASTGPLGSSVLLERVSIESGSRDALVELGEPGDEPTALAWEPDAARALVAVRDAASATSRLHVLNLREPLAPEAETVLASYAAPVFALATGPAGARILVLEGAASDPWIAGGVEQVRAIASFDPGTSTVGTTEAFAPPLGAGRTLRASIALSLEDVALETSDQITSEPQRYSFVWDTRDVVGGGEVFVRLVPFDLSDGQRGFENATGSVHVVEDDIVVEPELASDISDAIFEIAGGGAAAPISLVLETAAIRARDFDADGLDDLLLLAPEGSALGVTNGVSTSFVADSEGYAVVEIEGEASQVLLPPLAFVAPEVELEATATPRVSGAVADLDGDGALDVVLAWSDTPAGGPRLGAFLADAPGVFAPTVESQGELSLGLLPGTIQFAGVRPDVELELGAGSLPSDLELVTFPDGQQLVALADEGRDELRFFAFDERDGWVEAFVLGDSPLLAAPRDLELADVDRDGFVDLVGLAGPREDGHVVFLYSDPTTGSLVDAMPRSFPLDGASGGIEEPTDLLVRDLDEDGRIDLAIAQGGETPGVLLYDQAFLPGETGVPVFEPLPTLFTGEELPAPSALDLRDLTGDGRDDLVVAVGAGFQVFGRAPDEGDDPFLSTPVRLPSGFDADVTAFTVTPHGSDGDLDIVASLAVADPSGPLAFEHASPGEFRTPPGILSNSVVRQANDLCAADFDLDGDLDLVGAYPQDDLGALFAQASPGSYLVSLDAVVLLDPDSSPLQCVAADLDGDAIVDIAMSLQTESELAFFTQPGLADPGSKLPATLLVALDGPAFALEVGDLDGDGRIELGATITDGTPVQNGRLAVVDFHAEVPTVLVNPAAGSTVSAAALAVGDLLGQDGEQEFASIADDYASVVFATGGGAFESRPIDSSTGPAIAPTSMAAGDLDGDGRDELVVGGLMGQSAILSEIDAGGAVRSTILTTGLEDAFNGTRVPGTVLADVDRDGDLDVVQAFVGADPQVRVFTQSRSGEFGSSYRVDEPGELREPNALLAIDADLDGDIDIAVADGLGSGAKKLAVFYGGH